MQNNMRQKDLKMSHCVTLNKDIVWRIVDKEAVILNIDNGDYFSLNQTGTKIFLAIAEKKPLVSLGEILGCRDKTEDELSKDAEVFIRDLLHKNVFQKGGEKT